VNGYDRRVRDAHGQNPEAMVDELAASLESQPGRVAASLNRLGRRGLLSVEPASSPVQ